MTVIVSILAVFHALCGFYGLAILFRPHNSGYGVITIGLWFSLAGALYFGSTVANVVGALVSTLVLLCSVAVTDELPSPAVGKALSLILFVTLVVFVIRLFS